MMVYGVAQSLLKNTTVGHHQRKMDGSGESHLELPTHQSTLNRPSILTNIRLQWRIILDRHQLSRTRHILNSSNSHHNHKVRLPSGRTTLASITTRPKR
jgi:hypothetical protein